MASGSRDWAIKVYSSQEQYSIIRAFEDHTSSLIALKFGFDPKEKEPSKRLKLVSSGADKQIIVRNFDENTAESSIYHKEVCKSKIVSMDLMESKIVTGLDKLLIVNDLWDKVRIFEKKPEKNK